MTLKKNARRLEFQTPETKTEETPGSKKGVHHESKRNFRQINKLAAGN